MSVFSALIAFLLAAGLLTVTPGLDTMLVLRTAATEGRRAALMAALGIQLGCFAWGAAVALGLGVVLLASRAAYAALTWAGAAYLVWIGLLLLMRPRRTLHVGEARPAASTSPLGWLRRGLLNNLLNPKIGVFYVSFLPQFVPAGWPASPTIFGLALVHGTMGMLWLGLLAGGATHLAGRLRGRTLAWLDRATGAVFIAFGLRLAVGRSA